MTLMYKLKSAVNIDPLVMGWYAWPHLIAPHTFAMNIVNRHLKVMDSYVRAPHLHAQALLATKMKGAPFLDLPAEQAYLVQDLIDYTRKSGADLITLATEYAEFDNYLHENADGMSLESFYPKIPQSLSGMCELAYDAHHHPQIRLIEPLIYEKYYNESLQALCLSKVENIDRPFSLSTPIIMDESKVSISIPFSSPGVDILAKSRSHPVNINELLDVLNIDPGQRNSFISLFDEHESTGLVESSYDDDGVRVRYFSHACVLLEARNTSILIDPAINFELHNGEYLNVSHLPDKIDYVLLTHNHQDHVIFETLLQLRYRIGAIVVPRSNQGALHDPSLALILAKIGFKNVIAHDEFDEIELSSGSITSLPFLGEHADLYIYSKHSYHIKLLGNSFMFLADSNNLDRNLYKHIFKHVGSVDSLFIGMECRGAPLSWLYGALHSAPIPRNIDQSRRLSGSDCSKAMDIILQSGCDKVFIYAMGLEPWMNNIMAVDYTDQSAPIVESNKLLEICKSMSISAERLYKKKEVFFYAKDRLKMGKECLF